MDSYIKFFQNFGIDINSAFSWGIENTIFPSMDIVEKAWRELLAKITNNQPVYIRGYGRDAHATHLYFDFYKYLFNNECVKKDPTNNAIPQRNIEKFTALKRNRDIFNYQVSHIFGRTKNIFLFEAPWNIAYVPKIMDPFTGHEAKGDLPLKYQAMFLNQAVERYEKYIKEYNLLIQDLNIRNKLSLFYELKRDSINLKLLDQFVTDCSKEFEPILL